MLTSVNGGAPLGEPSYCSLPCPSAKLSFCFLLLPLLRLSPFTWGRRIVQRGGDGVKPGSGPGPTLASAQGRTFSLRRIYPAALTFGSSAVLYGADSDRVHGNETAAHTREGRQAGGFAIWIKDAPAGTLSIYSPYCWDIRRIFPTSRAEADRGSVGSKTVPHRGADQKHSLL